MFSHIMVGANNLDASKTFYDATMAALGHGPGFVDDGRRVFYMTSTGIFAFSIPIDGSPATAANGGTIGFAVESEEQGNAWHAAGIANGGTTCEDPPGIREGGMGKMYLAYLRDPAGNKLCALKRLG
jgi:catechol 2,3-dioxygenase-like lactoylglutathione lyase family enzyme